MKTRTTYCGACDRMVPVTLRPAAGDPGVPHVRSTSRFLCLDYGVRCTGALCPLEATPDLDDPGSRDAPTPRDASPGEGRASDRDTSVATAAGGSQP